MEEEARVGEVFPKPKELEGAVNFWIKIFSEYGSNDVLLHDSVYQDIIYAVIHLEDKEGNDQRTRRSLIRKEADLISRTRDSIIKDLKALNRLEASGRLDEGSMTPEQRHIFNLFWKITEPDRFKKAATNSRVRIHQGARDKFEEALYRSGYYAEIITDILDSTGVPAEFIALVFPESMFKTGAYSNAHAAGLWQFTRDAADDDSLAYLKINKVVDERRDPEKSTLAAARKLKRECDEYCEMLSDTTLKIEDGEESLWPHAAVGYIWGKKRVKDTMRKHKTSDLVTLIQSNGPLKKFWTKNYYPEFLAASYVYRYRDYFFPDIEPAPSWEETTVKMELPKDSDFPTIAKSLGIPADSLSFLNPKYTKSTVSGTHRIPKGSSIRIPLGSERSFASIEDLPPLPKRSKRLDDSWTGKVVAYIVQRGDTLWDLAAKVGVTVDTLLTINNLSNHTIIAGEKIFLPANE